MFESGPYFILFPFAGESYPTLLWRNEDLSKLGCAKSFRWLKDRLTESAGVYQFLSTLRSELSHGHRVLSQFLKLLALILSVLASFSEDVTQNCDKKIRLKAVIYLYYHHSCAIPEGLLRLAKLLPLLWKQT